MPGFKEKLKATQKTQRESNDKRFEEADTVLLTKPVVSGKKYHKVSLSLSQEENKIAQDKIKQIMMEYGINIPFTSIVRAGIKMIKEASTKKVVQTCEDLEERKKGRKKAG